MKIFKDTDSVILSLKLPDKSIDEFPTAKIYGNDAVIISTYSLVANGVNGYYTLVLSPGIIPVGSYTVIYEVFRDSGHSNSSNKYTDSEEFLRVENNQTNLENKVSQIINEVDDLDAQVT